MQRSGEQHPAIQPVDAYELSFAACTQGASVPDLVYVWLRAIVRHLSQCMLFPAQMIRLPTPTNVYLVPSWDSLLSLFPSTNHSSPPPRSPKATTRRMLTTMALMASAAA